jgi:hypothetical protein
MKITGESSTSYQSFDHRYVRIGAKNSELSSSINHRSKIIDSSVIAAMKNQDKLPAIIAAIITMKVMHNDRLRSDC